MSRIIRIHPVMTRGILQTEIQWVRQYDSCTSFVPTLVLNQCDLKIFCILCHFDHYITFSEATWDSSSLGWTLTSGTFFCEDLIMKILPLPLFQEEFMAKECTLNTGKLPLGGLPRYSVVKISDCPLHDLSCLPWT